jgi:hypothetical protein
MILPHLSMGGQRRPLILAPWLPVSPLQAPGAGFALVTAGSHVWGKFLASSKNRERDGALPILDTATNQ